MSKTIINYPQCVKLYSRNVKIKINGFHPIKYIGSALLFIWVITLAAVEFDYIQPPLMWSVNWCQGYTSKRISCLQRYEQNDEQWGQRQRQRERRGRCIIHETAVATTEFPGVKIITMTKPVCNYILPGLIIDLNAWREQQQTTGGGR